MACRRCRSAIHRSTVWMRPEACDRPGSCQPRPDPHKSRDAAAGGCSKIHLAWTGAFSAAPIWIERRGNPRLQVPVDDHGGRRRLGQAGHQIRPARHHYRPVHPQDLIGRITQLFNVLRGTMSLVGPRPHAVAHNEMYRKLISGYMIRHKGPPRNYRPCAGERYARRDRNSRQDGRTRALRS